MVDARCSICVCICITCNICVCICITWLNRGMAQGWLLLGAVPGLRNAASQPWSRPWHFGSCSLRTPCDARVVKIQVFSFLYFGYFARFWYLQLRAKSIKCAMDQSRGCLCFLATWYQTSRWGHNVVIYKFRHQRSQTRVTYNLFLQVLSNCKY